MNHDEMLRRWRWRDYANIILGVWLIAAPSAFGGGRDAWVWSDIISGGLIVALGIMTLSPRFELARWGICFVGIWMMFAPLVFWVRDPRVYASDTFVGAFVIAFSVL